MHVKGYGFKKNINKELSTKIALYQKHYNEFKKKHNPTIANSNSNSNKLNPIITCTKCDGQDFNPDILTGQPICVNCGLIIMKSIIDVSPEWKNYNDCNSNEVTRCSKTTDPLKPKTTTGFGLDIGGKAGKMCKWDGGPYEEKSLETIFEKINNSCEKYNISKVITKDAKIMCRMISQKKYNLGKKKGKSIITRGKNREGIIAASVFFACKRAKEPRSTQEISKMFKISDKVLKNGAKNFYSFIKINNVKIDMGTTCAYDFIQRKCDELELHRDNTEKIKTIAINADKIDIASTHTSYSLAAACILLGSKVYTLREITIEKISSCFAISKVTINKTYSMIKDFKNLFLSEKRTDNLSRILNHQRERKIISQTTFHRMEKFNIDMSEYSIIPDNYILNETKIHKNIIEILLMKLHTEAKCSEKYIELAKDLQKEFKIYDEYLNREINMLLK